MAQKIQCFEHGAYKQGFRMGFYSGMVAMGLFAIFVFIMTFIIGGRL